MMLEQRGQILYIDMSSLTIPDDATYKIHFLPRRKHLLITVLLSQLWSLDKEVCSGRERDPPPPPPKEQRNDSFFQDGDVVEAEQSCLCGIHEYDEINK